MGHRSTRTPGPSSHSHYSRLSPGYNVQYDLPSVSQGDYFSGNTRSGGLQEIQTTGGSSSHPYHPPVLSESDYQSITYPAPIMQNYQSQLYDPSLSSQGPSLTVPASPFPTDPSQPGTPYSTSTHNAYSTCWRGADRETEREGIENHSPLSPQGAYMYGVPMLPAPSQLSSSMIAGISPSLSAESYTQPRWQDDYADLTSFPGGRAESNTEDLVATQGQIATTQEASLAREGKIQRNKSKATARKQVNDTEEAALAHERRIQRKREKDKERQQAGRDNSNEDYERICDMLEISMNPRKTLARRIRVGVEAMAERQKLDNDLRHRLKETEAYANFLKTELINLSNSGSQSIGERTGQRP